MKYKICFTCKRKKLTNTFHKDNSKKDKLHYDCKNCRTQRSGEYYNNYLKKILNKKKKQYIKNKAKKPWINSYNGAKSRCNNKNNKDYKYYGGRGIKFIMTSEDFKFLWFRDKACNMKKPSIDRKDNDGNYELSNCKFIELSENSRKVRRKLIKTQVEIIRKLYAKGNISQRQLGLRYNVSQAVINDIINKKSYREI